MPLGTFIGTGLLEPMRCMSYFPVIIKTRHFKSMRAYFETYHKRPFDDIFLNVFNNGSYSQFNIMVCLPNSVLLLTYLLFTASHVLGSVHICFICIGMNMSGTYTRRRRTGMA
jgi:hypothetical protein